MRIVVFGCLMVYSSPAEIGRMAALPSDLIAAPRFWGMPIEMMGIDPVWVVPLAWSFVSIAGMAMLGVRSRITVPAAALLAIVVLGIPQSFGKIDHYHHLVWFALLLCGSPCADVWSFDAWRQGRLATQPANPGIEYGQPIRWAWILIGIIYFFPGFWKVVVAAPDWLNGDAVVATLRARWLQAGSEPIPGFDVPVVAAAAGSLVLVFELGFVFALLSKRARRVFVAGGILFHLSVYLVAGINFWTLVAAYVVFVPVGSIRDHLFNTRKAIGSHTRSSVPVRRRWLPPALVTANILAGLTLVDTWPIAVYPTFASPPDPLQKTIRFIAHDVDVGAYESSGMRAAFRTSRIQGLVWQVVLEPDDEQAARKARALAAVAASVEPRLQQADSIEVTEEVTDGTTGVPVRSGRSFGPFDVGGLAR
jgi:hypothetical protein